MCVRERRMYELVRMEYVLDIPPVLTYSPALDISIFLVMARLSAQTTLVSWRTYHGSSLKTSTARHEFVRGILPESPA